MDLLKAVSIIGRDLEEAIALLDQLSSVPGSHIVETELAKSRVHSAAGLLKLLPGLATTTTPEHDRQVESTRKPAFSQPAHDEVAETPDPGRPKRIDREEQTEKAEGRSGPTNKKESSKSIFADRFSAGGTLGEKMSSDRQEEVMSSVMHSKPIADIAAAIGMNDKFYFIRELFSGDAIAYNDTVKRLNAAASLGEAMKILDESTVMGSDPAAQSSFVDVVRRKFSIHV